MVIMKRRAIAVALVLLLTLGFIAACGKKAGSRPETSSAKSETSTLASSETTTEETTEAMTAKPEPGITVTDAVDESFDVSGYKCAYKIPKVTIPGKNTDAVNSKIKKELTKYSREGDEPYQLTYTYYIDEKIVSVLVNYQNSVIDADYGYLAYNVAVSSGELIKDEDVVKLYGITDDKFFMMVRSTYEKAGGISTEVGPEAEECVKQNLKRVSYKYIDPYFGRNGHLCFVGFVDYVGGAGEGTVCFDAQIETVWPG